MTKRAKIAMSMSLLIVLVSGLAACSTSTAPAVPAAPQVSGTGRSTTSSTAASQGGPKTIPEQLRDYLAGTLKYAKCLRAHGLNVTDPDSRGNLSFPDGLDKANPTTTRTMQKCGRLLVTVSPELDEYLTPNISSRELAIERRYARCMRGLGISGFPDPGPKGFPKGHWDSSSPQAMHAGDVCYGRVYGRPVATHPKG